ncbi:hypothetical protein FVE85_2532 [Porphyridium purpureum]|uniref:Uncharacterized protein n=1 Tax=Porphyridium purpureum TaxID=35688 RepID=A0A5J4YM99_PORPP|nr:hypothetical protein FVE85_2532 [Porphyridium purpureum]|eukprot:POR5906..scf291_13
MHVHRVVVDSVGFVPSVVARYERPNNLTWPTSRCTLRIGRKAVASRAQRARWRSTSNEQSPAILLKAREVGDTGAETEAEASIGNDPEPSMLVACYTAMRQPVQVVHAVNLTNGLELMDNVVEIIRRTGRNPGQHMTFCRIQSSLLEMQCLDQVLCELDSNVLLHLAMNHVVFVYDVGSRSKHTKVPRAIWYGVEFIKYAVMYLWFGGESPRLPEKVMLRGHNVAPYWKRQCSFLQKHTKKRIRYFRPYAARFDVQDVRLFGVCPQWTTNYDGKTAFYSDLLFDFERQRGHADTSSGSLAPPCQEGEAGPFIREASPAASQRRSELPSDVEFQRTLHTYGLYFDEYGLRIHDGNAERFVQDDRTSEDG